MQGIAEAGELTDAKLVEGDVVFQDSESSKGTRHDQKASDAETLEARRTYRVLLTAYSVRSQLKEC